MPHPDKHGHGLTVRPTSACCPVTRLNGGDLTSRALRRVAIPVLRRVTRKEYNALRVFASPDRGIPSGDLMSPCVVLTTLHLPVGLGCVST